jgi:tetratricopeptide (TPR) repeat protein
VSPDKDFEYSSNAALMNLVEGGYSFSGHEANCCFLNLKKGRFADVSSVTGLDFPDDGRAVGVVDWDFDGDVDFWITNRSSPQVRFLRNDSPSGHHFLALRLEGKKCNRDAIGARVEVRLKGDPHAPLMRTMRAGDGFLSQSSKWLQFGLGALAEIEHVVVRWPGGSREEFRGLQADGRYLLVQGAGQPKKIDPPATERRAKLAPSSLPAHTPMYPERTLLGKRVPLPRLEYETLEGKKANLAQWRGQPLLLVLWASWCAPCTEELKELQSQAKALSADGLRIVALSVDAVSDESNGKSQAQGFAKRLGLTLPCGFASRDLIHTLQTFLDALYTRDLPINVPYSFLLDPNGELAAVYRGAVKIPDLEADLKKLGLTGLELRNASVPFSGRWLALPDDDLLLHLATRLIDERLDEDFQFAAEHKSRLRQDVKFARFCTYVADNLLELEKFEGALSWCQEALNVDTNLPVTQYLRGLANYALGKHALAMEDFLRTVELDPQYVPALKSLAWIKATSPDPKIRNGKAAIDWARKLFKAAGSPDPAMYDVAAAAYAAAGRFDDAVGLLDKGIQQSRKAGIQEFVIFLDMRKDLYRRNQSLIASQLPAGGEKKTNSSRAAP